MFVVYKYTVAEAMALGVMVGEPVGTWMPLSVASVRYFERMVGKPPIWEFTANENLDINTTVMLTLYYYSTVSSLHYLVPVDIGFVEEKESESFGYANRYTVDSILTYFYNYPMQVSTTMPLPQFVSLMVSNFLSTSPGIYISYEPRSFENSLTVPPIKGKKFSDYLTKYLFSGIDYVLYSTVNISFTPGSLPEWNEVIAFKMTAVKSSTKYDGVYDKFAPITVFEATVGGVMPEVYPGKVGVTTITKRRIAMVVSKPAKVTETEVVPSGIGSFNCLGKTYNMPCVAFNYKLVGSIDAWIYVKDPYLGKEYWVRLCSTGSGGPKCDYAIDFDANERFNRLVMKVLRALEAEQITVTYDAVKVLFVVDDISSSPEIEFITIQSDKGADELLPGVESGRVLYLSNNNDYMLLKSGAPELLRACLGETGEGVGELNATPGTAFFERYELYTSTGGGSTLEATIRGLHVNIVFDKPLPVTGYSKDTSYLVYKVRFDGNKLTYELKPESRTDATIDAIEEIKKKLGMLNG